MWYLKQYPWMIHLKVLNKRITPHCLIDRKKKFLNALFPFFYLNRQNLLTKHWMGVMSQHSLGIIDVLNSFIQIMYPWFVQVVLNL